MKLQKNIGAIKRFAKVMKFANWLQDIPNKITPAPFRVMQIGSSFWQSRALYVATKLGLADVLADSEMSTTSLSQHLKLNEDHVYRLMRMLSSIGVFLETSPRTFKNSKLSNCLREDNVNNVKAMVFMHNSPEMTKSWFDSLEESIKDGGIPFERSNGVDLFEYMNENKDFDVLFSQAMDTVENVAGTIFLEDFNWGHFTRIIDVGGSKGSKSLSILKSNPSLKATVFDRPQIIRDARESWKNTEYNSILNRVEFVGGDILQSIPKSESNNDVYFFMAVFHTFNDVDCKKILHNLSLAIGVNRPYVVICDSVANEMNIDAITASMDMQMLMGTKGRERTLDEWKNLFIDTDLYIEKILNIRTFAKYVIVRKK